MSSLVDWLYTPESDGTQRQGALIIFPRMIDRWNVTSLIVSGWEGYKIVIVTDHPDELMDTVTIESDEDDHRLHENDRLPFSKWTNLELIPFPLIKYSELDKINQAIHNTEIDVVIFDDARMLAII